MGFKKNLKKIFGVLFIITFIFSLVACGNKSTATSTSRTKSNNKNSQNELKKSTSSKSKNYAKSKGNLKVSYIDVGQGDSILVQYKDKSMLIDAGPNSGEKTVVNYLKSCGITQLDYVIATHPHEDHIGGMDKVLQNFKVKNMYMPKKVANTKTFRTMIDAIKQAGVKPITPRAGETFKLGEAKCEIVAPNRDEYENTNNYSIVLKVTYNNNSFLFTGDSEKLSEKEILAKGFDISCDVLKLGHHGSHSSTGDAFLKKANPKYAVISCETGNDYGHPHKETMEKMKKYNIKVYRTDESKTIVATSDGNNIIFDKNYGSYNVGKRK